LNIKKINLKIINYWWKLKFTVQLLLLLIAFPEVDCIPGILNVFKVGVFVTATVWIIFNWNLTCFKIGCIIQYICQNKVIRQKVMNFWNIFIPSPILFFNFKLRLWLSDPLNRAIDSDLNVLNHVLMTLASDRVGEIVGNYWPVK
jgi:hypothetical protein